MVSTKNPARPFRCALSLTLIILSIASTVILPVVAADETDNWDRSDQGTSAPAAPDVQRVLDGIPNMRQSHNSASQNDAVPSASGKQIARSIPYSTVTPPATPAVVPGSKIPPSSGPGAGQPSKSGGSGTGDASKPGALTLKGGVTYCVPSGTPFKLKLATIPLPSMRQEIRDEEGNLRPAQVGEEITAKTTEDIYIDDSKVIPEGTEFHGKVSTIVAPRRVGRPGHLELKFDSFKTPDGRSFAFKAEANNFKPSTTKSKLRGLGRIAAHGAGGAALGTLVAYQLFGLRGTIAMHGYNIAGGAALGCTGGIGYALWSRGPVAVLEPGDEFQMAIDADMLVEGATSPTPKKPPVSLPGLEFETIETKIVKDGLGGKIMRVDGYITNRTHRRLNSIHLYIEDELGNRYPVTPDLLDNSETLFYIEPLSCQRMICAFQVEFPKLKHKLLWFDHTDQSLILEQKL